MAIVKKSFRITRSYEAADGTPSEGAISFGPRTPGEQGKDILAAKIATGMVSPNPILQTGTPENETVEEGVWFDCESSTPIDLETGTQFDKKFEIYLMNFQLQHREEIVRFLIKDLVITWPDDSQILAEDIIFDSELGLLGDATLHVLHGWRSRHDQFTNEAFNLAKPELDIEPRDPEAEFSDLPDRSTGARQAGEAALIYASGRLTSQNPLNDRLDTGPASFNYKMIEPHPEGYKSPLSEAVAITLERSPPVMPNDDSLSEEERRNLVISATEPDPFIDPDPFVLTKDLHGFFYKTQYDFDNPPIFATPEDEAAAIRRLEERALKEVLDHFSKPHIWFANPENNFFKDVWDLHFTSNRPRHSGKHTELTNWCLGYGEINATLVKPDSYQNYRTIENTAAKPLIEFVDFRTPTSRPGDVYRAYFEIYKPKLDTIEMGLVISPEGDTTFKSAALKVREETQKFQESAATCAIDTEEAIARIAEHRSYAAKRKKEIARRMREQAATAQYRQRRQDSALSYGGREKASTNLNLGPLGSYDFSTDNLTGQPGDNGFPRRYTTTGVNYDPSSRTLTIPQNRLKNIVNDAAAMLKKSAKDMSGVLTNPSINVSQEATLLKQVLPALDNLLKSSKDYQKLVEKEGFSYDPLGVNDPPNNKPQHGIDSKLARIDLQIKFEPVFKNQAEAEQGMGDAYQQELGLKIKSIRATTSGKSTILTPLNPPLTKKFNISPLNRPRTMNYFAQVGELAKGGGGIPLLGGSGCGLLAPSGREIVFKFTSPKLQEIGTGDEEASASFLEDSWNSARSGVQEWWNTSQKNLNSNNFGMTPDYNIADIMPSFGDLCEFEDLWDQFVSKFSLLDLICDYVRCMKLPNVNISLDIDFRLPPIPKLPTIDFMNFLRLLLTEMLIEMLKRMLCSIISAILDALKMDPCPGELEEDLFGNLDFDSLVQGAGENPIEGLNDLPTNARIGVKALSEALADTGLPPDRLEDAKSIIDDIFKILTPREICKLLKGESSKRVLTAIKNLIESLHDPFFAEHFSVEENIIYFFESVGVFISPDLCEELEKVDTVLGEITCSEMNDAISTLRRNLENRGKLAEDEIQKLLDIAQDNLDKRAAALGALMSGDSLASVVPDLFNPGSDDALLSALPDSFKNTLETASKAIFETAKMAYINDLAKFTPALYNNKQYLPQPGDPDYNAHGRMELEKTTEILRIFEQQLGGLSLDDERRHTVPKHVHGTASGGWDGFRYNNYISSGDGSIAINLEKFEINYALHEAENINNLPVINLFTMRESLYVDFVVDYYDPKDGKVYIEDNEQSPRIPFYRRQEILKPVDPENPNGGKIKVLSLVRANKFEKNTSQLWLKNFAADLSRAVREPLYGPQMNPGSVYHYGPKNPKSIINNYRDLAYYCYKFYRKATDGGKKHKDENESRRGHSDDEALWKGEHPVDPESNDHAHMSILRLSLIEDIGKRLEALSGKISDVMQQGTLRVTNNTELLPEIKPYFDKITETIKNRRTQDVEENLRDGIFGEPQLTPELEEIPVGIEAVDASLDDQGRPLVSLVFEPSTYIRTFDGRERYKRFALDNPPSIEFIENPWSLSSDTYSYTVNINDPYLIKKKIEFEECLIVPDELKVFVPNNDSKFIRRDSYAKLFLKDYQTVLDRYKIRIDRNMNQKLLADDSKIKNELIKESIYRSTLESMFEFVLFRLSNSNLFDESYVNLLEKRITGTKYYDPRTDCIQNPTGLSEGNILKFGDLISDMITEVQNEYAKPENYPQNMDFSQPGPVEKAFQNVIVRAIIKIFHIEFMLRGALTNSTYSPSYYKDNRLLDKYFEEFVLSQLANKRAFGGATSNAEETMNEFYKVLIRVSGVSQTSYSESNRKLALRSLIQKEKEKIPNLSNHLYQTSTTKDYVETFVKQLPILDVKSYIQYTEPHHGGVNDALNIKMYQRGNSDADIFFIQDIPQDMTINGGFYLEHYLRLNQKPGAAESLTNFRVETGEILREKIFQNLRDFAETQSFASPPDSPDDLEINVDEMRANIELHANDDEFRETEVISGRELQTLLSDYVEAKLFSDEAETELERELREEFTSTLNVLRRDECGIVDFDFNYSESSEDIRRRRNDLVDHPRVVRRLPSRLIKRNRTHFKISDFLWGKTEPDRESFVRASDGNLNEKYIKDLFKGSVNFDSRASEETRYYAIPMDACYHYERTRFWELNHDDPEVTGEMLDFYNLNMTNIDSDVNPEELRGENYHYTNFGGPQYKIEEIDAPRDAYKKLQSEPGQPLVADGPAPVMFGPLDSGDSDDLPSSGVKRGVVHHPHVTSVGVIYDTLDTPYHPFDPAAPWFSETKQASDQIEPAYSNHFGLLEKEEFQYVVDMFKENTTCTNTDTQEVEFEDWDEIVIDLYGESSVPYHIPGESFHLTDELPILTWREVEYHDFLLPYWNTTNSNTRSPNYTKVNYLSTVPQTIGEMSIPDTEKFINRLSAFDISNLGVGNVEYENTGQQLNQYGAYASPFRFSGNTGGWKQGIPEIIATEHMPVLGNLTATGLDVDTDGNYTTNKMKPILGSSRTIRRNSNVISAPDSWAKYEEDPHINGGHYNREIWRPLYWDAIRVSRPFGHTPMSYESKIVDKVTRIWRVSSDEATQNYPNTNLDPVYKIEFNERVYGPNTYYIPIRLLLTQVVRRGGPGHQLAHYRDHSSRGDTFARVLIPELLKPHDFPNPSLDPPPVNDFRKDLLQEAMNNIYKEYLDILITVRNDSRHNLHHQANLGFSPPNQILEEGDANFGDNETSDQARWNHNSQTRAYISNLPTFAKSAYNNDFNAGLTQAAATSKSINFPAFFSVSKLYSRACELEAEKQIGTFTSDSSKIDEQFLNNPGLLLKDWVDFNTLNMPIRDFTPKTPIRLALDGVSKDQDSLSIGGRVYHNCGFGFRFPFFSKIESEDIDTYDKDLLAYNRQFKSGMPKNLDQLIDDSIKPTFGDDMVATIDTIVRKWFGAKRYDSFWGKTSSRSWLFGNQLSLEGITDSIYRRPGQPDLSQEESIRRANARAGRPPTWDDLYRTYSYARDISDVELVRSIHKNWQCPHEWPNGPKCGLSPFVADGRWTITELQYMKELWGQSPTSSIIDAFSITADRLDGELFEWEVLNRSEIQDMSAEELLARHPNKALLSLIHVGPHGQVRQRLNAHWNQGRGWGNQPYEVEVRRGTTTRKETRYTLEERGELGYFTRNMMLGDDIGSINWMIDTILMDSEQNNPWVSDMIWYLKSSRTSQYELSSTRGVVATAGTGGPMTVLGVRGYLNFLVAAELKSLGVMIGEEWVGGSTNIGTAASDSDWAMAERAQTILEGESSYIRQVGEQINPRSAFNKNQKYLNLYAKYRRYFGLSLDQHVRYTHTRHNLINRLVTRKPKVLLYSIEVFARQHEFVEAINNIFWTFLENDSTMLEEMEETRRAVIEEVLNRMRMLFNNTEIKFGVRLVQVVKSTLTDKIMRAYRDADPKLVSLIPKEERSYFLKPRSPEDDRSSGEYSMLTNSPNDFVFCNPLISFEEEFPADCVNYHNVYRRYVNEEGRKYLRSKLFDTPEFRALTEFIYPLDKFATMTNIFSTQILSSRASTQEILDTTKVTLMEIFKTMINRNDFGRKGPFDHLGAAALSNSELFNQFNKYATSEGPDMKCIEFPDMGQFLEALIDQIKNIIYYTPSIILRGIASAIDPMYMDMKQKHNTCEPGSEHVKNLKWSGTTMYTEKKHKSLGEGTTGCDSNKYAPVFPGFAIDMMTSIASLLSFDGRPLGRTLDKFATYLYDADLPFFKFDFEFDIPCLMDEPYEKEYEAPTLGSHGRYGHFLSPITVLALSTPELPTEKNTKCGPSCDDPPIISTKEERDATEGCPELESPDDSAAISAQAAADAIGLGED